MPKIVVKDREPFEAALRRFKRSVEASGIIPILRSKEFYEKPTAERKRKKSSAIKRLKKLQSEQSLPKKLF